MGKDGKLRTFLDVSELSIVDFNGEKGAVPMPMQKAGLSWSIEQ